MAVPRKLGSEASATRARIVDAAERVLLEEGYAAVTTRRIAAEAGVHAPLLHYYFLTIDDLFAEAANQREVLRDVVAGRRLTCR